MSGAPLRENKTLCLKESLRSSIYSQPCQLNEDLFSNIFKKSHEFYQQITKLVSFFPWRCNSFIFFPEAGKNPLNLRKKLVHNNEMGKIECVVFFSSRRVAHWLSFSVGAGFDCRFTRGKKKKKRPEASKILKTTFGALIM